MAEPTPRDQAPKLLAHAAGYVGARTIEIGLERGLIGHWPGTPRA